MVICKKYTIVKKKKKNGTINNITGDSYHVIFFTLIRVNMKIKMESRLRHSNNPPTFQRRKKSYFLRNINIFH